MALLQAKASFFKINRSGRQDYVLGALRSLVEKQLLRRASVPSYEFLVGR